MKRFFSKLMDSFSSRSTYIHPKYLLVLLFVACFVAFYIGHIGIMLRYYGFVDYFLCFRTALHDLSLCFGLVILWLAVKQWWRQRNGRDDDDWGC